MADGVLLRGGYRSRVERVGDTVRRTQGDRAEYVHELLGFLEDRGWSGAPRYLGVDDAGREILSYIDGHVAWDSAGQPAGVWSHAALAQGAALLRELHDLTAGTPLAGDAETVCHNDLSPRNTVYRDGGDGLRPVAFIDWDLAAPGRRLDDVAHMCWQYTGLGQAQISAIEAGALLRELHDLTEGTPLAGDAEVVCHNDLSPRNTVYQDNGDGLRPVAFIDWDLAAPGRRLDDLAQMCWQYTGLGQSPVSAIEAGALLRVVCDGYGLRDRGGVIEAILWWQDRCWRGMRELADDGDPAMVELRERGVIDGVHAAHAWVAEHRGVLEDALR